jgi:hypothetical protein
MDTETAECPCSSPGQDTCRGKLRGEVSGLCLEMKDEFGAILEI